MALRRLALLAAVLLLALAIGSAELALTIAPLLLVAAFPMTGRFPGAALIAVRRALRPRPPRVRWANGRRRALSSLLERSPRTLRGPPVAA